MTVSSEDDLRAIAALRMALETAENTGDAHVAGTYFSDDMVIMVPDFPVQTGKVACVAFMQEVTAWLRLHFERRISYISDEVRVFGDFAFDRGRFTADVVARTDGTASTVTGKYFWLITRIGQRGWQITRMIIARDDEEGRATDGPSLAT